LARTTYTIEDMRAFARQKDGQCLSGKYINNSTPLLWKCNKCQNKWPARFANIKTGHWCPKCAKINSAKKRRLSIDDMHDLATLRGGKCKSKKYINAKTPLKWQCGKCEYIFRARPYNVKTGYWCPECGKERTGKSHRKYTFEKVKIIAKKYNILCLDFFYEEGHAQAQLECIECNHKWKTRVSRFVNKMKSCPQCSIKEGGEKSRLYTIGDANTLAKKRGGVFLSKSYARAYDVYTWKCHVKKHPKFQKTFSQVKGGQWCTKCRYEKASKTLLGRSTKNPDVTYSIKYAQDHAKSKNGECLSKKYTGYDVKMHWKCYECNHDWWAGFNSIVGSGTWCPHCVGREKNTQDMMDIATQYGGLFLSDNYMKPPHKMKWWCNNGHEFEADWNTIYSGAWCSECSGSFGERISRGLLQKIFQEPFPKLKPKWLKIGNKIRLELDGFSEKLNIAFEYHGEQHSRPIEFFHGKNSDSEYKKRVEYDAIKLKLCAQNGVKLIVIWSYTDLTNLSEIIQSVESSIIEAGLDVPQYTLPNTHGEILPSDLSTLQVIAKEREGTLISDAFLGWAKKHEWRCKNGHEWPAEAGRVRDGSWCFKCSVATSGKKRFKYSIQDLQEFAQTKGGECLSIEYIGTNKKYLWKCGDCNNKWEAPASRIMNGGWCPECGLIKNALARRKYKIDDLHQWAQKKKGKCLTDEYLGFDELYEWQCKKNHKWPASWSSIKGGTWCAECSQKKKKTIEDMHALAHKNKGKCISTEYINSHTHLIWRCKYGNEFPAMPTNIQRGKWCPCVECRRDKAQERKTNK